MDWKLELIVVPSIDVDGSKAFYMEQVGFELHVDHSAGEDFRVVQLNPPGSACSIAVMKQPDRAGAVQGLHLVVTDVDAARDEWLQRGVAPSASCFTSASAARRPVRTPSGRDYNSFVSFDDPDGNSWLVQEVRRAERAQLSGHAGCRLPASVPAVPPRACSRARCATARCCAPRTPAPAPPGAQRREIQANRARDVVEAGQAQARFQTRAPNLAERVLDHPNVADVRARHANVFHQPQRLLPGDSSTSTESAVTRIRTPSA